MAKSLRIHVLAKELGVKSKVIVEKCAAEGVPDITNHMSVVKLGLAATIRQWFADVDADHSHDTAIETSTKVDVKKVRKKATKKATKKAANATKKASAGADEVAEEDSAVSVIDAPETEEETKPATENTKAKKAKKAKKATKKPATQKDVEVEVEEAAVEAVAETPQAAAQTAEEESVKAEAPKAAPAKPAGPPAPMGVVNVPTRPDIIKPAGSQLATPKKVALRGPAVVRIEKPEPIEAPRPRGPRPPRGNADGGEVDGVTRSRGPARGGGVKSGGAGAGGGQGGRGGGGGRAGSRRSNAGRRSRGNDQLLTGPTKMSKADADELDARIRGASGYVKKRRRNLNQSGHVGHAAQAAVETGGKVEIEEPITIKALSAATGIKTAQVVKFLFKKGIFANVNSPIETEQAMEVCLDFDIELEVKEHETAAQKVEQEFSERVPVDVRPRPPVVTILGHVDHGKTSLLDRIREADVADHEDGGITQHVGAYRVSIMGSDGEKKTVVFLDTPGHAAFTAMRSRGAQLTDIIVLIVAADDGVMPQTIESINHAKAAGAPVVVAINKCDLPGVNEEKITAIYGQLAEHGLNPVQWGGETEVVKTSAETGEGVKELLETLDLSAEVLELTADFAGPARGTVIEGEMQTGRGSVARVLVQDGVLKVGDFISIGRAYGRVREMKNDREQNVTEVGPATPIELSGIDQIPDAGDKFYSTLTLKRAEEIAKQFRDAERYEAQVNRTRVTLDNFAETIQAGKVSNLNVVIKADVQGSVETLKKSLEEIGNNEVAVRVIHSAVGGVTENDVLLADASDAVIIGFHVSITPAVREISDERKVETRMYRVIYEVIDDIKKSLEGMLAPEISEDEVGRAEVKQVFKIGKVGNIAGCMVTTGSVKLASKMRVVRDGVVVTEGRGLEALRRVKDEAKEVRQGTECGIRIKGFEDLKPGDELICYNSIEVARKLD